MSEEQLYDTNDPAAVKEKAKQVKQDEKARATMIKAIMDLPQGRKWIWEILTWCHVFSNPFATNAMIMAHNCGEMNIGQRMMADIMSACPDTWQQMVKENNDAA